LQFSSSFRAHKNSRFQANAEILAVFYSERNEDFAKLIKVFGVIGTLRQTQSDYIFDGACM